MTCMVILCNGLFGQLVVEHSGSVGDYVVGQLLGPGITVENITFNGSPAALSSQQCGYFNSENSNVGFEEGIIISNGYITGAIGPNNSEGHSSPTNGMNLPGDMDLDELTLPQTHDAAVLEFDFVSQGDSLVFEYVFASEEYPEFANGVYNDVFGFFISGPGFSGEYSSPAIFPDGSENLARLPGSDLPISINTVNNGTDNIGPCEHCDLLIDNGNGLSGSQFNDESVLQYDGILVPITIRTALECGETYHIKFAIADAGDDRFDSSIFFKSGSFQSNAAYEASVTMDYDVNLPSELYYENCIPGTIHLSRSDYWQHEETISVSYAGNAQVDQDFSALPSELIFDALNDSVSVPFITLYDEETEGIESLDIIFTQQICGSNVEETLSLEISDPPSELEVIAECPPAECGGTVPITLSVQGGLGFYTYQWADGQESDSISLTVEADLSTSVIVQDLCVAPVLLPIDIETFTNEDLSVEMPSQLTLDCGDNELLIEPSVDGGYGELSFQWSQGGDVLSDETLWSQVVQEDGELRLIVTDECGGEIEAVTSYTFSDYNHPSVHIESYGAVCTGQETTVNAELIGGLGPFTYTWSEGESDGPVMSFLGTGPTIVNVQVIDACGQTAEDEEALAVSSVNAEFLLDEIPGFQFISTNMSANSLGSTLTYEWYVNGEFISEDALLESEFFHEDSHEVMLQVMDEYNCTDDFLLEIQPSGAVYVPSAFTPDEDGLNSTFEVKAKALSEYHLEVFDRSGKTLFESSSLTDQWDGSHPGKSHEMGFNTYFYSITATAKDGKSIREKGSVTVLR